MTILRKVHNRQSGAALFKKYDATVESFSNSTVKFTDGTVLRQSDLQFKPIINSDSFPVGKQKGAMKVKPQPVKQKPKPTDKSGKSKAKSATHKSPASQRREKKKPLTNPLDTTSEGNFSLEEALNAIKSSNPSSSKKPTNQSQNETSKRFYSKFMQLDEPYRPITASFSEATSSSMGADLTTNRQLTSTQPEPTAEDVPLDNTQLNNARDIATARESSQEDSRSEPQNVEQAVVPSEVSDYTDEDISNMSDNSPEFTSSTESNNLNSNKGMKYKIDTHIDPSLILQGGQKRKRSPVEKYVANTTAGQAPKDSYSNWQLAKEKKQREREARKALDPKKHGKNK